jgi:hypothetical protein
VTNPDHVGPAIGTAIGVPVGAITGNVAGGITAIVETSSAAAAAPFKNTTRVIRVWHTEKTVDGRDIQVPEDYLVDSRGRVIRRLETQ